MEGEGQTGKARQEAGSYVMHIINGAAPPIRIKYLLFADGPAYIVVSGHISDSAAWRAAGFCTRDVELGSSCDSQTRVSYLGVWRSW